MPPARPPGRLEALRHLDPAVDPAALLVDVIAQVRGDRRNGRAWSPRHHVSASHAWSRSASPPSADTAVASSSVAILAGSSSIISPARFTSPLVNGDRELPLAIGGFYRPTAVDVARVALHICAERTLPTPRLECPCRPVCRVACRPSSQRGGCPPGRLRGPGRRLRGVPPALARERVLLRRAVLRLLRRRRGALLAVPTPVLTRLESGFRRMSDLRSGPETGRATRLRATCGRGAETVGTYVTCDSGARGGGE